MPVGFFLRPLRPLRETQSGFICFVPNNIVWANGPSSGTNSAMLTTRQTVTLVITVVLFLGLGAGLATWSFLRFRQTAPDLRGFWEGALAVKTTTLRLVVKVDRAPDGSYTATLDSIDQGSKDVPLSAVSVSNRTVRFQLAAIRASFEGELNRRATEITGQWQQGGGQLPLTFRRTTTPSTIAPSLPSSAFTRRTDAPLQGVWKGTIKAGGVPLRVAFKIAAKASGEFVGTMDSLDQGARDLPLNNIEFSAPTVRFDLASIGGHYEGTIKEDASEIDGNWQQAGRDFRLLLKRGDPADEAAAPGDNAYAYISDTELQGIWNGTLNAGGTKLRLLFKIARSTNGTYSATMHSLDQGAKDIPATTATFNNDDVELEWAAMRALFHGKLEKGRLIGFWQQGASDFPLELDRTNRAVNAVAPGKN